MRNIRIIFCVLSAAIVALSSCKLSGKDEHTPEIYLSTIYKNPTDSTWGVPVRLTFHSDLGCYVTDTLSIADSVHMAATVYSFANNLQSFCVGYDTTQLRYSELSDPVYDQILLPQSDRVHGQHYFRAGYNQVTFQFGFSPDTVGLLPFVLEVHSDSEFPSSSLRFALMVVDTIH